MWMLHLDSVNLFLMPICRLLKSSAHDLMGEAEAHEHKTCPWDHSGCHLLMWKARAIPFLVWDFEVVI
jgi:hypothetical protein